MIMTRSLLMLAVTCTLLPLLPGQVQLAVSAAAESGIALELPGAVRTVQTFPPATAFAQPGRLQILDGSPLPLLPNSATIDHSVSGPATSPLPFPIAIALNRVSIGNAVRMTANSRPVSLHTTDNAAGAPGTQRYDVRLTANTQALVTMRLVATMYDNATVAVRVTGSGVNENWTASSPGEVNDARQATIAVAGTATLRVEFTATVTPGPGATYWDGYVATLYVDAYDVGRAACNVFGTGCTGTISGSGTPVVNTSYRINLDNAAPNTLAMLVLGDSRTRYQFLQLPLPLGYMGATGCTLNVAPLATVAATTDAAGHAESSLFLTRVTVDPTIYLQWLVFDPALNTAGLGTSRGAELLW
jgi:hypothetical protein